jgi:acyl carrier protein
MPPPADPRKLLRLQAIVREVLDDPALELKPEQGPSAYPGWDSVAMVQIVLAIEAETGARLPVDVIATTHTVADLLRAFPG